MKLQWIHDPLLAGSDCGNKDGNDSPSPSFDCEFLQCRDLVNIDAHRPSSPTPRPPPPSPNILKINWPASHSSWNKSIFMMDACVWGDEESATFKYRR